MDRPLTFQFYRYSLVPLSPGQQDLFREKITEEELKARKNSYFNEIFKGVDTYEHIGQTLVKNILFEQENIFLMKLGTKKSKRVHDINFTPKKVSDYPSIFIGINNDPNIQIIAISKNHAAFSDTNVVANILQKNFTRPLASYNLAIYIEPILDEFKVWELFKRHKNSIKKLEIDIVKPNLASISSTFKDEFRSMVDDTNSHRTNISLNASENGVLSSIDEDNEKLKGIVDYAREGGGNISLKVKGLKKKISTSKSVRETDIDELHLEGHPEFVMDTLKTLLK